MIYKFLQKFKQVLCRLFLKIRILLAKNGVFLLKNDKKLWAVMGSGKGKDAVVIGMGPSFKPEDVKRFEGCMTFACNKIYLLGEKATWRPDVYAVTDTLVGQQNEAAIQAYSGPMKFLHPVVSEACPGLSDIPVLQVDSCRSFDEKPHPFNPNPLEGIISGGGTVLATLIQLAYWADCKTIYVVGLDFSFEGGKKTGHVLKTGDHVLVSEGEVNHFHPDYRKPGESWTVPKYDVQRRGFRYAQEALASAGVPLLNASRTTKLDVLDRVNFEKCFPPVERNASNKEEVSRI